jgi:hypothetical protein
VLPTEPGVELQDSAVPDWVSARMAAAKQGKREIVRIPIVHKSDGWGCVCPDYYLGTDPMVGQGPWLDVTFGTGTKKLGVGEAAMAEGTFARATKHVSYPNGPSLAGRWEYDLIPFKATKLTRVDPGSDATLTRISPP